MRLEGELHVEYFVRTVDELPSAYSQLDTNRLTLLHFAVQSLDLLGALDKIDREAVASWIYLLQTPPCADERFAGHAGFQGGTFVGSAAHDSEEGWAYNHGHIAMTYTALCSLAALGDDLSRVHRPGVIRALRSLQMSDGSFRCVAVDSEHDMRFLYCACAISYILDDWSGVRIPAALDYISSCRSYDGAFALLPGQEGHGGSTFCAVASLALMGKLDTFIHTDWRHDLVHWCVSRQLGGMQGRPNKREDTCYSYWIGGTLRLLGRLDDLLDRDALTGFVLSCQTDMGGFSKLHGASYPDLLHSFYSLAWLSLAFENNKSELHKVATIPSTRTDVIHGHTVNDGNGSPLPTTQDATDNHDENEGTVTKNTLHTLHCALGMRADSAAVFENLFPT